MRDQVQWKIKRCDARHRPEWEAPHNSPASRSGLQPVEWQVFAVTADTLFGGDVEGENAALDFDAGRLNRLASFLR